MRITVLGATGGVGRHVVTHALADGHQVTAVVRDPAKLAITHPALAVVRADALDAASLKDPVAGADAVLSGIGPVGRRDPLRPTSGSARAAVQAMTATGVRRIVAVSAAPLNRTGAGQPWLTHRVLVPLLWAVFGDVYTDLQEMEAILRDSGLEWTALRPPRLLNTAGKGRYRQVVEGGPAGNTIPRADLARAMLDALGDPATIGHAVGVSS